VSEIESMLRRAVGYLRDISNTLSLIGLFLLGSFAYHACSAPAHADPQPALDRQLVERMVRALEDSARAQHKLADRSCK
jgi:hypothetical protein